MASGQVQRGRAGKSDLPGQRPRWWSFRIWNGMTAGVWFRFLARHGFAVSPSRIPRALGMSWISCVSTIPAAVQRRRYGAAIAAEPIPPPIFIVGHWRSGTTFLHELLATDMRFIAPTSLECFATEHFMRWGAMLRSLDFMLPARRPMDDMAMGWDRPQEDEFALMAMGQPSPYEAMAFSNQRGEVVPHLHVGDWPPAAQAAWIAALSTVMKRVALSRRLARPPKDAATYRMLLKSPTHTARIGVLRRAFPEAKFIHVTRDPFELYSSSERLWRATFDSQGLQKPRYDSGRGAPPPLSDFILNSLPELYRDFERDIAGLEKKNWAEVRYADLVRDAEGEIARILNELFLGPGKMSALRAHLAGLADYRRNRHVIDAATAEKVRKAWHWYFDRFGYDAAAGD